MKITAAQVRTTLLFLVIYATMFLFGLVENIKGVSFPLVKSEFGVNYESQGGLVSVTWFGYVIFCLAASLFLQRFGIKKSILAGYVLVGLGAVATLAAPSFWLVTLTLLIINAGFGFYEVGANALASVVFTTRAALMMNLMHFFYGFGAIAGPKVAGVLTNDLAFNWRQVYIAVLLPVAAVFLFILVTRFGKQANSEPADPTAEYAKPSVTFFGALRMPLVWMFCITLGLMEVIEFGAANWGGLYLRDVYGLDPRVVGASFVSMFYILFTLARLFGGLVIERVGYARSLMLALALAVILYSAGFGLGRQGIWILPFTGLVIGIMWPTMMALAMRHFTIDAPVITSAIITVSGAINGVLQFVVGLTNQYAGEAWGYRSSLLYAVLGMVMLAVLIRRLRAESPAPQPVPAVAD